MHAILALHDAVDDQDRLAVGHLSVLRVDLGLDGHVDLAELVLEGEEADLLGGGRGLARDHQPRNSDLSLVGDLGNIVRLDRTHSTETVAAEVDQVMAGR